MMTLSPDEVQTLKALQSEVHGLVQQVGQSEVRKQRLMGQIAECEERAQGVMRTAAERLGIAPGTPWQMTPEGQVIVLDPGTGMPVPAPQP